MRCVYKANCVLLFQLVRPNESRCGYVFFEAFLNMIKTENRNQSEVQQQQVKFDLFLLVFVTFRS